MLTQFICFNQDVNKGRSRQSIAHEIVHIWLERPSSEDPFETEAECLTAYLLASIPIIITAKRCIRAIQVVQNHFKINHKAAHITWEDTPIAAIARILASITSTALSG